MTLKRLSSCLSQCLLSIALSLWSQSCDASANHDNQWIESARKGHYEFAHKNYQTASVFYKQALQLLESADPGDETSLDVGLSLAEVYVCDKKLSLAEECLDLVNRAIEQRKDKLNDPLLPARYFRRLSLLRRAQDRKAASAAAYARSVVVFRKCFDKRFDRSKEVENKLSELLGATLSRFADQSVEDRKDLLSALEEWADQRGGSKTNVQLALAVCRKSYETGLKVGKPELTQQAVTTLTALGTDKQAVAMLWMTWWKQVANEEPDSAVLEKAAQSIDKGLKNSNSPDVILTRRLLLG
ncbi:MAG: hypothetical protein K2Z81_01630, partial [Cyanobacteria bacterium]|nr:hypothetical protein [Cyanobacteriota bacterium]